MDSEVETLKKTLEDKENELKVINEQFKEQREKLVSSKIIRLKERIMKGSTQDGSDGNQSNYEFQSVQEKLNIVENQMESQKNEILSLNGLIQQDKVHIMN